MSKSAPKAASSNWKALKQTLSPVVTKSSTGANGTSLKRKRTLTSASESSETIKYVSLKGKERQDDDYDEDLQPGSSKLSKGKLDVAGILSGGTGKWQAEAGQYLAIDCEMVGVGPEGSESTLARVSIVNFHGAVVLDKFVRPREKVTDFRTWVSGVREEDLRSAPSFVEVQKEVANIIKDRILIGHAISNDTDVLLLSHPRTLTRDTAKYAPLQGLAKTKRPGLKTLAKLVLGVDIQSGEHSSVDDARATMAIYRSQKSAWEDSLRNHTKPTLLTNTTIALSTLDLSTVSLTGVAKSKNPDKRKKALGLAATLRFARNEAEEEEARLGKLDEEAMDERGRKKVRREREDDIVLGFDYEVKKVVVRDLEKEKREKKEKKDKEDEEKKKKDGLVKKVRKVVGRAFKGDREKRPRKSAESWWAEDE